MPLFSTPEQQLDDFKRMLLVIPGMNEQRAHLVSTRYHNMGQLWRAFRDMTPDIDEGNTVLNASLFSDSTAVPASQTERWVYNLYRMLMGTDPNERLYEE
ncbi:hypothetical protein AAF712_015435 [Marasmius tenuissimus]|uniref:Uncharacterized protein n=1 Tax=Marasmius tenuissimus TaxID=585030 RepID=A0ABR2Z9C9_9AGAR